MPLKKPSKELMDLLNKAVARELQVSIRTCGSMCSGAE